MLKRFRRTTETFDPLAERGYYHTPITELRDPWYIGPYYRTFLGDDFQAYFKDKQILDIGAGECLHGYLLSTLNLPQRYVNFDLITGRMRAAAMHGFSHGMYFCVGDCFSLPFKDSVFDVVWGSGILFRLRPLTHVIYEVHRVLRQTGIYLGIEPNFHNPLIYLRFATFPKEKADPNDSPLLHDTVRRNFMSAGFNVELRFFWVRLPWLRHRIFSPTMGIIARKSSSVQL